MSEYFRSLNLCEWYVTWKSNMRCRYHGWAERLLPGHMLIVLLCSKIWRITTEKSHDAEIFCFMADCKYIKNWLNTLKWLMVASQGSNVAELLTRWQRKDRHFVTWKSNCGMKLSNTLRKKTRRHSYDGVAINLQKWSEMFDEFLPTPKG